MNNILLVILYRMLVIFLSFINYYILLIMKLTTEHKILVVGDFTLDEMSPEDVPKFYTLM